MAGKDKVVAGSTENMAQVLSSKVAPDPAKAAMHAQMLKPAGERSSPAPPPVTA